MRKTKTAYRVGNRIAQILAWLFFIGGMILVMHGDKIAIDMGMLH